MKAKYSINIFLNIFIELISYEIVHVRGLKCTSKSYVKNDINTKTATIN